MPYVFSALQTTAMTAFVCLISGCSANAAKDTILPKPADADAAKSEQGMTFKLSPLGTGCASRESQVVVATDAPALDPARTRLLVWASAISYTPSAAIEALVRQAGFTTFQFIEPLTAGAEATGLQAFVAARPGMRVLVFRGSDDELDWKANRDDALAPASTVGWPGQIHSGYAKVISATREHVRSAVERIGPSADPLFITGHSLGGAMATLFGAHLQKYGVPVANITAFASPRVGDVTFAYEANRIFGSRHERHIVKNDFVPRSPAPALAADESARLSHPDSPETAAARAAHLRAMNFMHVGPSVEVEAATGQIAVDDANAEQADLEYLQGLLREVTRPDGTIDPLSLANARRRSEQSHSLEAYGCALFTP